MLIYIKQATPARYIADMYDIGEITTNTWSELEADKISVTKNEFPFVSIVSDHACVHLNKVMKVRAGLIGISNNATQRQTEVLYGCTRTELIKRVQESV